MPPVTTNHAQLSQAALEKLAAGLSLSARPGLVILLEGDLGTGKTTFARAFLRALAGDPQLEVPSPTFSLMQSYDDLRVPAAHIDLYRLEKSGEALSLGIEDLIAGHVLLIEWPDRLGAELSPDILTIRLSGSGERRDVMLTAAGRWVQALQRAAEATSFIAAAGHGGMERQHFEGDASSRRYEILEGGGKPIILMDMPERPDGPIIKDSKTYSRIAHLAENIGAVIAVNRQLRACGYSAPEVWAHDVRRGFALIEYLGQSVYGKMTLAGFDMHEPMKAATELLADMATRKWPSAVPVEPGLSHHVPVYDAEALLIEVDLLPSWYWPYRTGEAVAPAAAREFETIWQDIVGDLERERRVWSLRDYHSPNLLWMPEREGLRRVGLIDTQDCVLGHPAYDLASLLQDARVDMPLNLTKPLLDHYCALRTAHGGFDEAGFRAAYAILGAQRSTKILGIFARLFRRDGKPAYLKHMPRVAGHLARNLAHPRLAKLKAWFDRHIPLDEVR